jgi:ABC-type sugar transport system permease subunit
VSQQRGPALAGVSGTGAGTAVATTGDVMTVARRSMKKSQRRPPGEARWVAAVFLGPAVVLLAVVLLYPLGYTVVRSLLVDGPGGKAGAWTGANYSNIVHNHQTFQSLKNNLIWVLVAPAAVTILGLIFAVLTERIRWSTAFKIVLFMPMAISLLASGVSFSLIYSDQPSRGLANAVTIGLHNAFFPSTGYPNEHPSSTLSIASTAGGYTTATAFPASSPALVPMVGLSLTNPPKGLQQAALSSGTGLHGVVWNDFRLGGGGTPGKIDPGELGLKGITVDAVQNGKTVASATTSATGAFDFSKLTTGSYQIKLPSRDFTSGYSGVNWLGPNLITPAIIVSFLWVYAGFAMVLIASGMAAIPRDALEAARMDGATEWQVFRRVTAPLLAPVLMVVFVTLVINVLKVFDLVYIISAGAQSNGSSAQVLATQLYQLYSTQQYGGASAVGIVLVVLVLPAMAFNVRRFRREQA